MDIAISVLLFALDYLIRLDNAAAHIQIFLLNFHVIIKIHLIDKAEIAANLLINYLEAHHFLDHCIHMCN